MNYANEELSFLSQEIYAGQTIIYFLSILLGSFSQTVPYSILDLSIDLESNTASDWLNEELIFRKQC